MLLHDLLFQMQNHKTNQDNPPDNMHDFQVHGGLHPTPGTLFGLQDMHRVKGHL